MLPVKTMAGMRFEKISKELNGLLRVFMQVSFCVFWLDLIDAHNCPSLNPFCFREDNDIFLPLLLFVKNNLRVCLYIDKQI